MQDFGRLEVLLQNLLLGLTRKSFSECDTAAFARGRLWIGRAADGGFTLTGKQMLRVLLRSKCCGNGRRGHERGPFQSHTLKEATNPYRHSLPVLQHVLGLPLKAFAAQNRLTFQAESLFYKHFYVSAIMNMTDLIHNSFDGMTLALVCSHFRLYSMTIFRFQLEMFSNNRIIIWV